MKFKRISFITLAIYLAFLGYLYVRQDQMIFFPERISDADSQLVAEELKGDYVTIRTDDGVRLEGWFLSDHSEEPRPTIIFFGGNAMRIDRMAFTLDPLRSAGLNLLLMDYRGYGLSGGEPNTDLMKLDAEKIFDAASSHPYVDNEQIIAWGYSLGTGIATHLASVKPVSKVILFVPFTSTTDLAKELYPFVPVSLLLKHRLDNLSLAKELSQPALIVAGSMDGEFSPKHAEKVASAWKGPVELFVAEHRGHNDLLEDKEVWKTLVSFMEQ